MKRILLALLFPAAALLAQTEPATVLPETVVTATRVDTPTLETPAFTTVISREQIEQSGATDLSGLLREAGGVNIFQSGPEGAVATVSVRGSTSSQVLVLVNGVPLNSSRDGTVDLSQIPLDQIARVEIVRGGESSVYGTDAVGGVINIITRKSDKPAIHLNVENGSYLPHTASTVSSSLTQTSVAADPLDLVDTQKISARVSTSLGAVGISAAGGFTRAANGFTWDDTTYIDGWRREDHAGGTSGNGYLAVTAPLAFGRISASGSLVSSSFDVPGSLSYPTTQAEQQRTTASGAVTFDSRTSSERLFGMNGTIYYQYDDLHAVDFASLTDSTHITNTVGGSATGHYRFSDLASITYGLSSRFDHVHSTDVGIRSRFNVAGYASTPFSPTDRLTLSPSLRYDYFSDVAGGLSYRLGSVLALNEMSSLKFSVSESYRAPTINDLYWPSGAYAAGNPNLQPETAYASDFGYSLRHGALSLDAALFGRFVFDQIVWEPEGGVPTNPWTPQNLGKSFLPGAEVHLRGTFLKSLSLSLDYTFIYSVLLNDGSTAYTFADNRRVLYVPMNSVSATVAYEHRGSRFSLDGQFTGTEYTDGANTESTALKPHLVLNAGYRQKIGSAFTFTLSIRNLLNAEYQTQSGYPMPPISLWTGIELSL